MQSSQNRRFQASQKVVLTSRLVSRQVDQGHLAFSLAQLLPSQEHMPEKPGAQNTSVGGDHT